jgi:hypothetical protein
MQKNAGNKIMQNNVKGGREELHIVFDSRQLGVV